MRNCGPGSAGAQLHDAIQPCIGQAAPEALGEAGAVGVMADEPAVADDDGIHRVQGARVGRELIEQRDDFLLAGIGDVESGEAASLCIRQQPGQRLDAHAELVQVDELVAEVQALLGRLVLMQRR